MPWTALTPDATWRSRLGTLAEWSNTERHTLFSTPSVGVNVFHVCLDVRHVLGLGICQHICVSSLYLMVFDSALPGTLEEKLGVARGQMCIAYDALRTAAGERLPHALFV